MVWAAVDAKFTVLVAASVPKLMLVIEPVVVNVIVAAADTSTAAFNTKVEPTVKLQALVPSPTIIFEFVPDTVQPALITGAALFRILNT